MKRLCAKVVVSFLLVLVMAACGEDEGSGLELEYCTLKLDGDILIGEFLPFDGDLATFGPYLDPAVAQAIMEINQGGGIHGQTLGYVQCNTSSEANVAIAATVELFENFDIPAIVGPILTPCTFGMLELLMTEQVTANTFNQLPQVTHLEDDGYIFRTTASAQIMVDIAVQTTVDNGWLKTFAFHQDDGYGNPLYEMYKEGIEQAGGQSQHYTYRPADTDNYAEIAVSTARESYPPEGPDLIMSMTFVEDGAAIMGNAFSWRQEPDAPKWFMFNAQKHPEFVRQIGGIDAAIGVLGCSMGHAANQDYQVFADRFVELWGNEPFDFSPNAYDAVYTLAIAMALSDDPTDGTQIRDNMPNVTQGTTVHPQEWERILSLVPEGRMNYEGASGSVDFDSNGDVPENVFTWVVNEQGVFETECWRPDGSSCGSL